MATNAMNKVTFADTMKALVNMNFAPARALAKGVAEYQKGGSIFAGVKAAAYSNAADQVNFATALWNSGVSPLGRFLIGSIPYNQKALQ